MWQKHNKTIEERKNHENPKQACAYTYAYPNP
jgi:hypothetical protein